MAPILRLIGREEENLEHLCGGFNVIQDQGFCLELPE
jgi:hypothetical protein